MLKTTSALPRILALTALIGSFAVASPVFAATTDSSTTTTSTTTKHHMHKDKGMMGEDIETRIKTLHDKLMITADQEDSFNAVAQVMRDNETNFKSMIEARHQNGPTMTAVEDLESYQKIAQAHVDGLQKLIDAFKPLYDGLSDDQKKNADEIFGRFEGHRPSDTPMKGAPKSGK